MQSRSAQKEGHPPGPAGREGTIELEEMIGAEECDQERNDPEAPGWREVGQGESGDDTGAVGGGWLS